MKLHQWVAGAALAAGMVGSASAALVISVNGPDSSTDIDITLAYPNISGPAPDLVTLTINFAGGIILNDGGESSPGFSYMGGTGFGTSNITLNFSGWDDGETLRLTDLVLDPGSPTVSALVGTIITASYTYGSPDSYRLVDNPARYAGLVGESYTPSQVPLPGSALLLGAGLLGLGALGRRR